MGGLGEAVFEGLGHLLVVLGGHVFVGDLPIRILDRLVPIVVRILDRRLGLLVGFDASLGALRGGFISILAGLVALARIVLWQLEVGKVLSL